MFNYHNCIPWQKQAYSTTTYWLVFMFIGFLCYSLLQICTNSSKLLYFMHHVDIKTINRLCNSSAPFMPGSPLANRLEKSVSVRLKCASLPLLSQDSRFLAVRSLRELTILLLSSRLLFFCKNPKRLQEEEASAAWLHSLYMLRYAGILLCQAY